jgi:hypothetical protein
MMQECGACVLGNAILRYEDYVYLLLAPVLVFLGMLRYLNGSQVAKTRRAMHRQLNGGDTTEPASDDPEGEGGFDNGPAASAAPSTSSAPSVPAPRGVLARTRAVLLRHRGRPHLFSGIEFEMFVCVVAPATAVVSLVAPVPSLIVPVVIFAAVALAAFEAIIVARLWRSARRL